MAVHIKIEHRLFSFITALQGHWEVARTAVTEAVALCQGIDRH